jgi:hypothetical protein
MLRVTESRDDAMTRVKTHVRCNDARHGVCVMCKAEVEDGSIRYKLVQAMTCINNDAREKSR